jgi:hypothetical protein
MNTILSRLFSSRSIFELYNGFIVKSWFGKVSQMIYFLSSYFKLFTSLIDKY